MLRWTVLERLHYIWQQGEMTNWPLWFYFIFLYWFTVFIMFIMADLYFSLCCKVTNVCYILPRYARADAAKRLLDAKADANAQDSTGRTPLHAAVSADAQGVFQVTLFFVAII